MIQVNTEHESARVYPSTYDSYIDENGTLTITAGGEAPVACFADGEWGSIERLPDDDERVKEERFDAMNEAALRALARYDGTRGAPDHIPMFTADELEALYQAAHGTEGTS